MAAWFGESWGAVTCDPEEHVPTPVGEACVWCAEEIAQGDRGFSGGAVLHDAGIRKALFPDDRGKAVRALWFHLECGLRLLVGPVAHQERRCTCFGGRLSDDAEETFATRRRAALEAVVAFYDGLGLAGRCPPGMGAGSREEAS